MIAVVMVAASCTDPEDTEPTEPDASTRGMDASTPTLDAAQRNDAAAQVDAAAPQLDAGRDAAGGPVACVELDQGELTLAHSLSPLPAVPKDSTNAYADNAQAAELGRQLFFDARYAGPLAVASDLGAVGEVGKVSCYSCHSGPYLDDQRSSPKNVSLGANFHTRNAPTTINSAFYTWTNWGGRFSRSWELPMPVAENPVIMNSSRLAVAHLLFDHYRDAYNAVFEPDLPAALTDLARFPATGKPKAAPTTAMPSPPDGAWEAMAPDDRALVNRIFVNYGKSIAAYIRLLVSRNAPFDQYVAGATSAIDCSARRGLQLFVGKARCVTCHLGPQLSDNAFHNLGVPQTGAHVPALDEGRYKDVPPLLTSALNSAGAFSDDPDAGLLRGLTNPEPASTIGQFRTPSLRGVASTAPYMHSGQLQTLSDVIDFYDRGGEPPAQGMGTRDPLLAPLHLSAQERADLLAFLGTLTGEPVPDALAHPGGAPYKP